MNKYNSINSLNTHFSELEYRLEELRQLLGKLSLLAAQVFVLPEIFKGAEHDAIEQISVTARMGSDACNLALQHFQRLFIHHNGQNISSKASVRLPGVLCFSVNDEECRQSQMMITHINQLKIKIEQIVTVESGLAKEQRFEFVHTHLHGLITLNAYRTLTTLINPNSVRFGWANKHVIKRITRDDVLIQLNKSLSSGRAVASLSREQWAAQVSQEIRDMHQLPENAILKIKRPVKVQPIARIWYQEQQKQVQHPCAMPLIALCQHQNAAKVPIIGHLPDYDIAKIKYKYKPVTKPLRLLIPRLHLYMVDEA